MHFGTGEARLGSRTGARLDLELIMTRSRMIINNEANNTLDHEIKLA